MASRLSATSSAAAAALGFARIATLRRATPALAPPAVAALFVPRHALLPPVQAARRGFAGSASLRKKVVALQDVAFTGDHHPEIKRDPKFAALTEEHIRALVGIVGEKNAITDKDELLNYNIDWMKKYRGKSAVALKPTSTEKVSQILKYCNEHKLAVVPQGGNTGLVGGGVPVHDEVIINLSKMNHITSFDSVSGAILEVLDNYLAERGFIMPLDLGAKGSCHIGGNVATNAGGLRLLRYGSLHGSVLGLEVVLADGTVLENLSTLRKDNTGYDLKQLFIGSEGTLGIITGVSILAPRRPKAYHVALLAVKDYDTVQKVFQRAKADLGEILSAFEFWDGGAMDMVLEHLSHVSNPLGTVSPFFVLIETSGSNQTHDDEKLSVLLDDILTSGLVDDATLVQDTARVQAIWAIREGIPEACSKSGAVYKYDISLPVANLYDIVGDMQKRLENTSVSKVIGYGHMGDGNLHLNITAPTYESAVTNLIEPYVYEWTSRYNGSISAEHGIGLMKPQHLHFSKSRPMIEAMRKIKNLFDPNGILNPYKVLP